MTNTDRSPRTLPRAQNLLRKSSSQCCMVLSSRLDVHKGNVFSHRSGVRGLKQLLSGREIGEKQSKREGLNDMIKHDAEI